MPYQNYLSGISGVEDESREMDLKSNFYLDSESESPFKQQTET